MKLGWEYFKDIKKHAINMHSVISFAFIFITPFLPMSTSGQAVVGVVLATMAIVFASYYSWKDLYLKVGLGTFSILPEPDTLSFGSINGTGMIQNTSQAFFNIDLVNNTNQPQVLQKLLKTTLLEPCRLFDKNITKVVFREANNPQQEVILPIKVNANDRRMLQIVVKLPVVETYPEKLPFTLAEIKNVVISLTFRVSNQHGDMTDHKVELSIQADDYIKEIVRFWKEHGCPELYESYQRLIA